MFRRALIAAFAALALAGCATASTPPPAGDRALTLERTRCFGFCPDYSVTVHEDGRVVYVGRAFVGVTGEQRDTADSAAVARLFAQADRVNLPALRRAYRANISDIPSFTVTLRENGRAASVLDYGGLSVGMPQGVRDLQDEIDRVARTQRWTARTEGRPTTPPQK